MAARKKPWEDVVSFDDWKQDVNDKVQDEEPGVSYAQTSVPQEIQGIGIIKDEEDVDLSDMISNLNKQNSEYVQKVSEEAAERREKALEKEREIEEQKRAEILRAKFEAEAAERERIAFEETEALAAAERERQEKSIKSIAGKFFKKKPKESKEENVQEHANPSKEEAPTEIPAKETDATEDLPSSDGTSLGNEEEKAPVLSEEGSAKDQQEQDSSAPYDPTLSTKGESQSVIKVKDREKRLKKKRIEREVKKMEDAEKEQEDAPSAESIEEEPKGETPSLQGSETDENALDSDLHNDEPVSEEEIKKEDLPLDDKEEPVKEYKEPEAATKKQPKEKPEKKQKEKKPLFLFGKKPADTENKKAKENKEKPAADATASGTTDDTDWKYLATHDELTGLLNQRAYEEQKAVVRKKPFAIVCIDINNLKNLNDTMGHPEGNKLIVAVADKMKEMFPENSFRIGGDEFVAIVEYPSVKKIEKDLLNKKEQFNEAMLAKTKEDSGSGLVYSASFGYAFTDGSKSFEEVSAEADKAMYEVKEAYKKENPQLNPRKPKEKLPDKKKKEEPVRDYDSLLTSDQRDLKTTVKNNHRPVSVQSTAQILRDIQSRASEVVAILIADPNFDQLFIILKPEDFINIVIEMESMIDYSYLYILYEGGPQYKGSDEYLSEVTHIFEAIGNGIKSGRIRSEKDFQKIKGINVFKNIYIDM